VAHFAELDENNIVLNVIVIDNPNCCNGSGEESEEDGIAFCKGLYGENKKFKKTSYNTYGNVHSLGGTPFRKNYAEIGGRYDEEKDAFIGPQLYPSWTLNEETCLWEPPVPKPTDRLVDWDENSLSWVDVIIE
jgi:hypothetical protein